MPAGSSAIKDGKEPHDPEQEEDAWDAVGLEYVDLSLPTAHDARLAGVRESLQTVMWPGMVRKPLSNPNQRTKAEPGAPVPTNPGTREGQRTPFDLSSVEEVAFLQREQATLDAWLDDDDDGAAFPLPRTRSAARGFEDDFAPPRTKDDGFGAFQSGTLLPSGPSQRRAAAAAAAADDDDANEDDDDDPLFPYDPTHLLTHLQSLRDELSSVPDDQRRARAAREVARLFAGLGVGLDGLDLDLEEDLDPGEESVQGDKMVKR